MAATRSPASGHARVRPATEQMMVNSAHRAVDDPAALARAARIVRAALARQRITLDELTPLPVDARNAGAA